MSMCDDKGILSYKYGNKSWLVGKTYDKRHTKEKNNNKLSYICHTKLLKRFRDAENRNC